jgi:HD-GYP domain-containing protein (c-di-GMP phosphodiesterase class II)
MDSGLDDLKKANVTTEEKGQIAQSTLTDIAENSKKSLESEVNYKATEQRVNKVMDFLLGEKGAIKNVLGNSGVALDTYMHSANVATLSLSLAPRFDIKDSNALLELGMAALMHDIGLEGLDLNFDTPPEQYTPEQLTLYQTHTRKGAEKAADKPFVNPKVVDLIMNHHEVGEGLGFPNKKRLATLPMSQQVLNLCNSYDESCTVYNLSPLEAMKQFYVDKMGLFDLKMVDVLKEILKVG